MEKILVENQRTPRVGENFEVDKNKEEKIKELAIFFSDYLLLRTNIFDWDAFNNVWQMNVDDYETCNTLLTSRKNWLEVMSNSVEFKKYFEVEILLKLDSSAEVSHSAFTMIASYSKFDFKDSSDFMNSILDHETVWNSRDGSAVHDVIDFLTVRSNEHTPDHLIRYINNIFQLHYRRGEFKDADIYSALKALKNILGKEKAEELLISGVQNNSGAESYFRQHPNIFNFDSYLSREFSEKRIDVDLDLEKRRIVELEGELEGMRNNAGRPNRYDRYMRGPGGIVSEDFWDDSFDNPSYLQSSSRRIGKIASEADKNIAQRAAELVLKEKVAPTAAPAIEFHMFNFLAENPDAYNEEIKSEFERINKLSKREEEYSKINNPLPTIGIEVEIPSDYLGPDKVEILDMLGIKNTIENAGELWEVNPGFSYSAGVQARIIQELAHMGAIPIDPISGKVEDRVPLSLHVNFALPSMIEEDKLRKLEYRAKMVDLNDLINYAFTSVNRIYNRKTKTAFRLSGGASTSKKDKFKDEKEQVIDVGEGIFKSFAELPDFKSPEPTEPRNIVRLELRATEFRDYPTFRMLAESQRLVAMLNSFIKYREGEKLTFVEACLADLWNEFYEEISHYLYSEAGDANNFDKDLSEASRLIEETDIRMWSRFLITDYSKKVSKIIEEATPLS